MKTKVPLVFEKADWLAACKKLLPEKTEAERLKFWEDACDMDKVFQETNDWRPDE